MQLAYVDGLDMSEFGRKAKPGRLVVVSNRVPVPSTGGPAAGGLAVALELALKASGGLWFGWSGKTSTEPNPPLQVQTVDNIDYAVADLSRRDVDEFYHGFANQVLWPICHYRLDLAEISSRHATGYYRVNEQFARRLQKMLQPDDVIWIHDYHFIPLASMLRNLGCKNRIGFFLHIPWPPVEMASAIPTFERLMRAFTAYDLIGFQTARDATNFRLGLTQSTGARFADDGRCQAYGRRILVADFPIGIDTEAFAQEARVAEKNTVVKRTRASLEGRPLIIGVDRLDYSKGIKQRLDAFSAFLDGSQSAIKQRVTLLQVTPKSRSEVPEYARMQREIAEQVGHINGKLGDVDWTPVRYVNKTMSRSALAGLYRIARCGLVTPLRDGMNLVAKEYVAAQAPDDPGVLILSQFAGAAQELDSALFVNPYDIDSTAAAIETALAMSLDERKGRWAAMMAVMRINTVEEWARRFLRDLGQGSDALTAEVGAPPPLTQGAWTSDTAHWMNFGH